MTEKNISVDSVKKLSDLKLNFEKYDQQTREPLLELLKSDLSINQHQTERKTERENKKESEREEQRERGSRNIADIMLKRL